MKTIRQLHQEWAAKIMPAGASPIQRQEMERAFYSGAFACFMLQIADIATLEDAEAERAMDSLHKELEDYFRLMRAIPGPHGTQRQ